MDAELIFFRLHVRITRVVTNVLPRWCRTGHELACLIGGISTFIALFMFHMNYVGVPVCVPEIMDGSMLPTEREILRIRLENKWSRWETVGGEQPPLFEIFGKVGFLYKPVYEFAVEKSLLIMTETTRKKFGVQVRDIVLDTQQGCLGGPAAQFVLEHSVGYDTLMVNTLIETFNGTGFVKNMHSAQLTNLNYASAFAESMTRTEDFILFKFGVLITSLFLFFTSTTVVSFTLRESQVRMMKFTHIMQDLMRSGQAYDQLIVNHILESLTFVPIMIGVLFFLFEFFNDQLLAFMVLAVVWVCELFTLVCVRTDYSIRFFPKFFFMAFSFFLIYCFSYPFGFTYMAYWTAAAFIGYSLSFFWNNHEVPALEAGLVSAAMPRQTVMVGMQPGVETVGLATSPVPYRERLGSMEGRAGRPPYATGLGMRPRFGSGSGEMRPFTSPDGSSRDTQGNLGLFQRAGEG